MITASDNFISKVSQTSRRFTARFLCNGAEVTCDVKTVKIYKGACGDAFLPGSVYSSYIESVVDNLTANIENKELELQIGLYLVDGTVEYVPVGLYTVTKPKISAYQTTFTAVGRIASRLSVIFSPPSEKTIAKITEAITAHTGINIAFKGITASGTIQQNLAGLTCRDVLEIIASVLGGFATEDNTGGIAISKFSADVTAEYTCERMLELPTFNEYDYSVSGVKVIVSDASEDEDGGEIEEVSFTSGDPKLIIKNSYMTAELFTAFAANIIGFTYRPGTVPLSLGDPRIEPWDCIRVIDVKGDSMIVPCMNIVHSFDGGLSTTIGAPGDSESGADASNKGPATKAIERMAAELLTAEQAIFKRLKADEAELKYVKIDQANIDSAWVENLLVTGKFLVDSIHGESGYYSKDLVGVNITGDMIIGNTIKADSLILQGTDGIYRRLNIDALGKATVDSDPKYNEKLDGSVLVAKSVTATEINVSDLFAQDITATGTITGATLMGAYLETSSGKIAGFTIDNNKLSNAENPTSILDIGYTQEELKRWPGAMGNSYYLDYQGNMKVGIDNTGVGFYSLRRRGTPPVTISEIRSDYNLKNGEKTELVSSKVYAGLSGESVVFVVGENETMDSWIETWYSHSGFGIQRVEETAMGLAATYGTMQAECNLNITGDVSAANLTRESVTISGLPSGAGYTCYYYPVLKICFLRLYYTGKAISATTATTLGTVASGYRPSTRHALAAYPSQDPLKHRQAAISSDGGIMFYSEVAKDSTDDTYIAGFWFV